MMLREETLGFLRRFGLSAEPSRDEQQLIDPEVIGLLIHSAGVGGSDTVLEVGPGAGNITVELAKVAGRVLAIERDPKWLPLLRDRLAGRCNVELVEGDALRARLPCFTKVVSNLPYSIVEAMAQRLTRLTFDAASFLIPSSFASTATASRDGEGYTRLSYVLQAYFAVEKFADVSPTAYYPEPRTRTSILILKSRPPSCPVEAVIRGLIRQKDKTLGNALREAIISVRGLGYPGTKREARALVARLELDVGLLQKRVSALSLIELLNVETHLADNSP